MARDNYTFSQIPKAEIPRSSFDRSHGHKTTFDSGYLIPIYVDEALPGDTFQLSASFFARLATPAVPFMDNLHLDVFWFAVPNRLVWDNWEKFCGSQDNPDDPTDYTIPICGAPIGGFPLQSLADYMGIPPLKDGLIVSSLWFRAYNLIWNEWFRDENLCDSVNVPTGDGPDFYTDFNLLKRGKRHDYFTSCLPWPQKGAGATLPLGTYAPVVPDDTVSGSPRTPFYRGTGATGGGGPMVGSFSSGTGSGFTVDDGSGSSTGSLNLQWGAITGLRTDLSAATAASINSLRQAFQIQKLLERDARGGTRYVELLKSHFGVVSPDFRLQRPEFLGGGTVPVIINPVAQTSGTGTYTDTPQGNLAAFGIVSGGRLGFSKSFVEHSLIIGLAMVRADLSYQQGVHRMFNRRTRYDFYWPAFSHLGEQAVLNKELYAQGTAGGTADDEVFGYQERWAEYRYFPSKITGKFRSGVAGAGLDYWHLAQEFTGLPTLSSDFILEAPPVERVVVMQTEPQFLFDSHYKLKCTRPMPVYSVPGLIDHF